MEPARRNVRRARSALPRERPGVYPPAVPPGLGARRAILVSTMPVLAGGGAALVGSLVLRILMARALEPSALGLVLLAIAIVTPGLDRGPGTNRPRSPRRGRAGAPRATSEGREGTRERGPASRRDGGSSCRAAGRLLAPLAILLGQKPGADGILLPRWPPWRSASRREAPRSASREVRRFPARAGEGHRRRRPPRRRRRSRVPRREADVVRRGAAGFAAGSRRQSSSSSGTSPRRGWVSAGSRAPARSSLPGLRPFAATEVPPRRPGSTSPPGASAPPVAASGSTECTGPDARPRPRPAGLLPRLPPGGVRRRRAGRG